MLPHVPTIFIQAASLHSEDKLFQKGCLFLKKGLKLFWLLSMLFLRKKIMEKTN